MIMTCITMTFIPNNFHEHIQVIKNSENSTCNKLDCVKENMYIVNSACIYNILWCHGMQARD